MIRIEIKLDNEKIRDEGFYTSDAIFNAVDEVFAKYCLSKSIEQDGSITYSGTGAATDFGAFASVILFLKDREWFIPYVERWLWYNSADGSSEGDFVVEDILAHYMRKMND